MNFCGHGDQKRPYNRSNQPSSMLRLWAMLSIAEEGSARTALDRSLERQKFVVLEVWHQEEAARYVRMGKHLKIEGHLEGLENGGKLNQLSISSNI